jgi:hypothetical protein
VGEHLPNASSQLNATAAENTITLNFRGIAFLEMTELRFLNQLFGAMRALDYVTGQIHSIQAGVLIEMITKLMFANSARLRKQSRPVA